MKIETLAWRPPIRALAPAEGPAGAGDRVVTLAGHAARISQLRKSSRTPSQPSLALRASFG
jgi:hypothetical protein